MKKLVVQLLIIVRIRHRYQHLQRQTIWMVRVENVRSLELFSRMEDIRDTAKFTTPYVSFFNCCFFLNDRDESSFLEALLSMANDPVKEKQKRRRLFGTCGGITLARVLRTSKKNTKEQREIGFNLVVRKARLKFAVVADLNQYNRDVVGISSEGDKSFLVYRPPPPKPNRSTSTLSDLWARSPFTNEV